MKNKNTIIVVLAVLCCILIGGVGYTVFFADKGENEKDDKSSESELKEETSNSDKIVVDGVEYRPNTNIQTILFMGIDKQAKGVDGSRPGENGQSDSLNLLIVDRETKQAKI